MQEIDTLSALEEVEVDRVDWNRPVKDVTKDVAGYGNASRPAAAYIRSGRNASWLPLSPSLPIARVQAPLNESHT
jgi:hypothetical protein